ncbi:shikimate dehydrogenase [Polycladidibacter hongkongensis]|uniref:shikimate dehydrogenase n=1 Tax=Polycladidibacter hongkongensis TaxID=1647556 RepID=UPI000836B04C|nr:shikimate dehydrogenase [Pseudovibrio hongkongensis]
MKKAAITGHPVSHSKSPEIHSYWLKQLGLEGEYGRVEVSPSTAMDFYQSLKDNGLDGCNVTIPNKEIAFEAAQHLDDAAKAIGAVNTLWLDEDGVLCGSNTDGLGFLGNLDQGCPGWDNNVNKAVVLGAGGAARAIIWALQQRGFNNIHICNRTFEKSKVLADYFGGNVSAQPWENRSTDLEGADLLVNTTALGMKGQPKLDIALDKLSKKAVVTDIVYTPLMTDLLKTAIERGNPVVDGLGMLLHQATVGFAKWFGQMPEVTEELRQQTIKSMDLEG